MCHHPGGSAPFSLLTYAGREAARGADRDRHRESLHAAVEGRSGRRSVRRPASAERARRSRLLRRWVGRRRAGRRAGVDQSPVASRDVDRRLATRETGSRRHAASSRTRFRPKAPTPFASSCCRSRWRRARFVRGLEFRPGNPRVVHHANIRIDTTPASRALDEADPGPGYDGLIAAIGALSGRPLSRMDAGTGRAAAAGRSRLAPRARAPIWSSSCTCSRAARPEQVQPSIGLYFGDQPPTRTPAMLRLGRQNIDIPAGDAQYTITDSYTLPVDVEVRSGAAARALSRARRARRGDAARRLDEAARSTSPTGTSAGSTSTAS